MTTIASLPDIHIGHHNPLNVNAFIDSIQNQYDPEVFIFPGDVSENGTNNEFEQAVIMMNWIKRPFLVVPGNHDKTDWWLKPRRFEKHFNEMPFVTTIHNDSDRAIHFIGLNSTGWFRRREFARGRVPNTQIKYMISKLKELHGIKCLILHHHVTTIPKYAFTRWWLQLTNAYELLVEFYEAGGDIIFSGHRHVSFGGFYPMTSDICRNTWIDVCAFKNMGIAHIIKIEKNMLAVIEADYVGKKFNTIFHYDNFFGSNGLQIKNIFNGILKKGDLDG